MGETFNKYTTINAVLNTLSKIKVSGYDDCVGVVGSIQLLNQLRDELSKEEVRVNNQIATLMKKISGGQSNDDDDSNEQ